VVIFLLGDDRAYLSWLAHHRNGFVVDWLRKPTRKSPVIHRASCAEIKTAKTKHTHWTTGRHLKACSLDLDELVEWAKGESGGAPVPCGICTPADDSKSAEQPGDRHLTKLGKEIVDYVVEAAVIHLDQRDSDYHLTLGHIAAYLDKTAAQISSVLIRLATDGYVRIDQQIEQATALPDDCQVYPTSDAMRTLPAFEKMPEPEVEAELEGLTGED
jgi:hypothetical protein